MNGRELMHLRNRSGPVIRTIARGKAKRSVIEQELVMDEEYDASDYVPTGDLLDDVEPSDADLAEIEREYAAELIRDPDESFVDLTVEDLYPADQDL